MKKIIYVTNMEPSYYGMKEALSALTQASEPVSCVEVELLTTEELWTPQWQQRVDTAEFVLVSWMGTGLCCDFLRKLSAYMHNRKKNHFMDIMDPGTDVLEFGITDDERARIKAYFRCGGLKNYEGLVLWLAHHYAGLTVAVPEPLDMPQAGIYHPDFEKPFLSLAEYEQAHWQEGKPVIGFIFLREDWLWGKLAYQDEIIRQAEAQGCNIIAVFSSPQRHEERGNMEHTAALRQFFTKNEHTFIDVLLNPFVFLLTVTGHIPLTELQRLDVPILQIVNLYLDKKWWLGNMIGLTANEISYAVAMPEFDGALHSVPVSTNELMSDGSHQREPLPERIDMLIRKAKKWARLRHKANKDKKIAIVFHNYPPTNAAIGSASCIDSIESVRLFLCDLQRDGYVVDHIPESNQAFIEEIIAHATNDRRFISKELLASTECRLSPEEYKRFFEALPEETQAQMIRDWGEAPGEVFVHNGDLIVPGMVNGNIFITMQPPRGFGDDPGKIYHSPDCAPTHQYLGFYYWIRDVWQADVMVHVGTHGNLEWLPGKGNAMNNTCYPDICTGDMPNVYPYWITCVGEGIQAKRRSGACLISYLSAPMSTAGTYDELADLEQALDEYCHFRENADSPLNLTKIQNLIRERAAACHLEEDVREEECADFDEYMGRLHTYITDIKNMQMSIGLHILGEPPTGEHLVEYIVALLKMDNGKIPSLPKLLAEVRGYEYYDLLEHSSTMLPDKSGTYGMLVDAIMAQAREMVCVLQEHEFSDEGLNAAEELVWVQSMEAPYKERIRTIAKYICERIVPNLRATTLERENILKAFADEYIEPSPSGAPTSGGADLLPTGRNFYSVDPRTLPTKVAWELGKEMAEQVITRFIEEERRYPESVGIILWATSNLRNHGQCVAEFLYLMGLRPVWQAGSLRVVDLEVIPLEELQRPRVDVTGRISGLFRDSMPHSVDWLDAAVKKVAELDEPLEMNFVKKHILAETGELVAEGMIQEAAYQQASIRIFGDPPGAHGAGIGAVLDAKNWETIDDLAAVYTRWGGHAYGANFQGDYMPERFKKRMSQLDITVQNVDHRESSMLSGDDYNSYRGGMVAAVRSYKGSMPKNYVSDSSDQQKVQLRSLDEELKRWFRGEAMNPKYIEGMKQHGYKGAGDLAQYVDVIYQWDATSDIMENWMYEAYANKYALDKGMQEWFQEVNPWALHSIAEVLLEAEQRGLWQAAPEMKEALTSLFLSMEGTLEEKGE